MRRSKLYALAVFLLFCAWAAVSAEKSDARCTIPTGFAMEGDIAHTIPPGVILVRGDAENIVAFLKQRGDCATFFI